ncbi:MAG: 16S rRNA (guanine(966)-N(2))-methyltransferase RsmD [Hyphomicrobiaceae bacterium]
MRVIAGTLKGRVIAVPKSDEVRPTSDRVREALFNVLAHGVQDFSLDGANVLDLFAGTGALAIEALSRGARAAVLVETSPQARAAIQENVTAFGLGGVTRIFRRDATGLGQLQGRDRFTLALADPPYGKGLAEAAMRSALEGGWLAPGAVVVVEESAESPFTPPSPLVEVDRRTWGGTVVVIARLPFADGVAPS